MKHRSPSRFRAGYHFSSLERTFVRPRGRLRGGVSGCVSFSSAVIEVLPGSPSFFEDWPEGRSLDPFLRNRPYYALWRCPSAAPVLSKVSHFPAVPQQTDSSVPLEDPGAKEISLDDLHLGCVCDVIC
jgi:hypothetical protein